MKGNIFIDIPKSGFPRKIQEVPVFQEKYVRNLREVIQMVDSLFLNEEIKKELESRLKKLHACMENIRKAGEFTTKSAGEVLEKYYGLLSFIFCTDKILYEATNILKPLLSVGITVHRLDVYVQSYSFPVLTALYAAYAYTEWEKQDEKERLKEEDDLFLRNMFLKLFPSSILQYYSTLPRTATESDMPPEPNGIYMHFTGILPEHTAEKVTEAVLSHMQENDSVNTSPMVVSVCGPFDKKQILKTAVLTETLLEKEGCFIQTKLVFIIPEHLPLPDISWEVGKKDAHSVIVSVSIKHGNIFSSPNILKEALNNCDILVLAEVSSVISVQIEQLHNMLVSKQKYTFNSFGKKFLHSPQNTAIDYAWLYGILLVTANSGLVANPTTMLETSILQTIDRLLYDGDVRAKNTLILSGPEVFINKNELPVVWEDNFTKSSCTAFHTNFVTEVPVCADDSADIIFPLFKFTECVPKAVQFMEHMVEKWNSDSIYIKITCNHGLVSWNPVITGMETTKYETRMYPSSCHPSSFKEMDNKALFSDLILSVYEKDISCYNDFRKSQLSSLLYAGCRSISGLVFCRKLETEPETIIMQTKKACCMEKPPVLSFSQEKKLFYDLVHELDTGTLNIFSCIEYLLLSKAKSMGLSERSVLEKAIKACKMACYEKTALYTNLETCLLNR